MSGLRVLHLVKTSVGATWAWRQVRELVRLGVEVHVAVPPGGPMIPRYEEVGVTVHALDVDLPIRRPDRLPAVFGGIRALVRSVGPDLLHLHNVGVAMAARLALGRQGPPRLFQVPGPLHLEHTLPRLAELRTAGSGDFWLASSEYTRRLYLAAGVPEARVGMSYYGTDVDRYRRGEPGPLRAELGLGPEVKLVGMVAYMYAPKRYLGQARGLKGHEDLIDAVALGLREQPDLRAVFVGGAWAGATAYEAQVRAYGRERLGDRAIFLGTRTDVPGLYPDLDVVAHPSHSENAGGAVESLLLEVPTVATAVGGFPEIVRPGETGWLVPPRSPEPLAAALLDVLDDPKRARAMACRGRDLTRELFDVRRTAPEVLDQYHHVLREAGTRVPTSQVP
jgi:glycosyltransferase involved in cell wall biosynthesis